MARPKIGDTRKMITLPAELAQAIEDFRFENRLKTEAEAIRRLIVAGLSGQGAPKTDKAGGKQPQVEGKRLPPATLGRASSRKAGDRAPELVASKPSPRKAAPRAKAAAMSKEVQIRALRERDGQ
jgi:hypothetical protein